MRPCWSAGILVPDSEAPHKLISLHLCCPCLAAESHFVYMVQVFEAMMECVYKSCHPDKVDIKPEMAEELLQAADQYMLDDLKHLCEASICSRLTVESLPSTYDLAENYNAPEV